MSVQYAADGGDFVDVPGSPFTNDSSIVVIPAPVEGYVIDLVDLNPGVAFQVRVAFNNTNGMGPWSEASNTIITPTVPKPMPAAPTVSSFTDSWAVLTWTGISDLYTFGNGDNVSGFNITIVDTTDSDALVERWILVPYDDHVGANVTGLVPGHSYVFAVAAVNSYGVGASSPESAPVIIPTLLDSDIKLDPVISCVDIPLVIRIPANVTGTPPLKFEDSGGSLPTWLSIDGDGAITGTPNATAAATEYDLQIVNNYGSVNVKLNLTVLTFDFSYPVTNVTHVGDSMSLLPTWTTLDKDDYEIEFFVPVSLPSGFTINTVTGEISTSSAPVLNPSQNFTVTLVVKHANLTGEAKFNETIELHCIGEPSVVSALGRIVNYTNFQNVLFTLKPQVLYQTGSLNLNIALVLHLFS